MYFNYTKYIPKTPHHKFLATPLLSCAPRAFEWELKGSNIGKWITNVLHVGTFTG